MVLWKAHLEVIRNTTARLPRNARGYDAVPQAHALLKVRNGRIVRFRAVVVAIRRDEEKRSPMRQAADGRLPTFSREVREIGAGRVGLRIPEAADGAERDPLIEERPPVRGLV